jgi:hypothetical protein
MKPEPQVFLGLIFLFMSDLFMFDLFITNTKDCPCISLSCI